jgi:hypothetical protein
MGNSKSGGEDDITAKGKYLLISVPDFGDDTVGDRKGQPMTSYLRLGAASTTWDTDPGGDLARKVLEYPEHGGRLAAYGATIGSETDPRAPENPDTPFVGDLRTTDGSDGYIPPEKRKEQSDALFTRGGWRDHSDGNRVTTTFGDKIEVIRGDYKMLVLGRRDDFAQAAGWDASGGHIQDFANSMPGASARVEYRQDKHTGVWHLENNMQQFVQTTSYAGDFFEHWWGNQKESTIGSEAPPWPGDPSFRPDDAPRNNPIIIDKTWASRIESYTGSSAWRIPLIKEETFAHKTESLTDVATTSVETTKVGELMSSYTGTSSARIPRIVEETWAEETESTTNVVGLILENTTAGSMTSMTSAGIIAESTNAGAKTEITLVGATASLTVAGIAVEATIAANQTELFIGTHIEIDLSAKLELILSPKTQLTIPDEVETRLTRLETTLKKTRVALEDTRVALEDKQVALENAIVGIVNLGV